MNLESHSQLHDMDTGAYRLDRRPNPHICYF